MSARRLSRPANGEGSRQALTTCAARVERSYWMRIEPDAVVTWSGAPPPRT
jgi:hypothetical protein